MSHSGDRPDAELGVPLPSIRYAVVLASLLWLLSGAGGFAMSRMVPTSSPARHASLVAHEARARPPLPPWHRLLRQFLARNLAVTAVLLFGVATLGISSVVGGLTNGWSLGMTIGSALGAGAPARAISLVLLPHGVFELTGLILACAIGLNGAVIGLRLVRSVPVSIANVRSRYGSLAAIAVGLIVLAALVECSITPMLGGTL